MRISKVALILGVLALTGAGCFGSGKTTGNDGGVFKTVNGGTAFAQQTVITSARGTGSIGGSNVSTLAMDPEDNKTIYAGTVSNGLIYSLDGAASWQQAREPGLLEGAVSTIAVDPASVCVVYVAKAQHLYKTSDCMRSFNADAYVETRNGVSITRVAVDWYDPKIVWLGLSNGDVLKSDDGAATWQTSVNGKADVTSIAIDNADSRVVVVGTDGAGFWRTADSGATWTQIKDTLKDFRNAAKVTALSQTKDGGTLIAATAYGLIRSADFGVTWEGLQLLTSAGQVAIRAVAVDPSDANVIAYAAGSTFYRSVDGGVKWTTSKISSARAPTALLPDPTDAETLYLSVMTTDK